MGQLCHQELLKLQRLEAQMVALLAVMTASVPCSDSGCGSDGVSESSSSGDDSSNSSQMWCLVHRVFACDQGSKRVRVAPAPARGCARTRSTRACSWEYGRNGRGCRRVRVVSLFW